MSRLERLFWSSDHCRNNLRTVVSQVSMRKASTESDQLIDEVQWRTEVKLRQALRPVLVSNEQWWV